MYSRKRNNILYNLQIRWQPLHAIQFFWREPLRCLMFIQV